MYYFHLWTIFHWKWKNVCFFFVVCSVCTFISFDTFDYISKWTERKEWSRWGKKDIQIIIPEYMKHCYSTRYWLLKYVNIYVFFLLGWYIFYIKHIMRTEQKIQPMARGRCGKVWKCIFFLYLFDCTVYTCIHTMYTLYWYFCYCYWYELWTVTDTKKKMEEEEEENWQKWWQPITK